MLLKRPILDGGEPEDRKRRREADREPNELNPEFEEHEAHSAFEDSDEEEAQVAHSAVAVTSIKPAVQNAPAPFIDLDSELAALMASRELASKKKSRKSLFGAEEFEVNEVQPLPVQADKVESEEADTVVLYAGIHMLSPSKKQVVLESAAALKPETPALGSPPRVQRKQSAAQSPSATRSDSESVDAFTPVKFHKAEVKKEGKKKGINDDKASGVIGTPSGRSYMFKPISKEKAKQNGTLLETVNEIVAGNLFRLYLGKNRAPKIGLCISGLTSENRIGVSSEMFGAFRELKDTAMLRSKKPQGFEDIMVTSAFLGDTDPHGQNVGYNQNSELSKVDHGRAFLASFKNGQDFIDYLVSLCKYHLYPFTLSINAIITQLTKIKNKGLRKPTNMIHDAIGVLERSLTEYHNPPFRLGIYDQSRWVDPMIRAKLFVPTCLEVKQLDTWEDYKNYITTILHDNFEMIDRAIDILQTVKANSYDEIQYDLHATARQLCTRKDFLVEVGMIDKSVVFPVKGKVFPYKEILLDEASLFGYVDLLDAERTQAIVDAINAKRESEPKMLNKAGQLIAIPKILNRDGLIMEMGLPDAMRAPDATKAPVAKRMASEATVPHVYRQLSHVSRARGLSDATAPQLYRYGTSHAGKVKAERAMPEEGEMKRD